MNCTQCGAAVPTAGRFCQTCGHDQTGGSRRAFAVKPNEAVRSFRLVSSIMPRGAAERPRTYQIAFAISLIAAIAAAALGALPVALMLAAFAIPVVYIVYLYDVNLWEDEPVPVTGLAFILTFGLAALFTLAWKGLRGPLPDTAGLGSHAMPTVAGVLIAALLVPVVGELIRQVGPVLLASRPAFDDLMDGLTFGIISGVAYATADTLVKNWSMFGDGFHGPSASSVTWVSLMVLEGFVKPIVIGTATGIACAEFSGLGEGYDGFSKRYVLALGEAVGWNILYFGGVYLLSFVTPAWLSLVLSLVWGLVLMAALLIRVRTVLQTGLVEAALEYAARFDAKAGVGAKGRLEFCPACEMPLLAHASFCAHCGQAVRTAAKTAAGGSASTSVPAAAAGPAGAATASSDARFDDEEVRS